MKKKSILALTMLAPFMFGIANAQNLSPQTRNFQATNNPVKNLVRTVNYSSVTDNPRIIQALKLMNGTTGEWSQKAILGKNLSGKPIKVMFKDLALLSPSYRDFDALGWKEKNGQLKIFINNKHRNAPPEALACLLCHEAIHQDRKSSITEETYGWTFEAVEWIQLKKKNPSLSDPALNIHPLVLRMNKLEKMYIDGGCTDREIRKSVSGNPGYRDLPEYSPGFGQ